MPQGPPGDGWVAALGVALLLVLAGCGSAPGVGTDSPSRTITPAPVPTETRYPPGISRSGLADRGALLAAHQSTLTGRSYTVTARTTVTFANGSNYRRVRFGSRVGPEGARHVTVSYSGAPVLRAPDGAAVVTVEWWQNGSRRIVRRTYANGSSRTRRATPIDRPPLGSGWLGDDIDRRSVEVAAIADEFLLRSEQPYTFSGAGGAPRAGARLEALVGPNGRIQRASVAVPVRVGGRNATARRVTRVDAVDASGVQRPSWVEAALNVSRTVTPTERTTTTGGHVPAVPAPA